MEKVENFSLCFILLTHYTDDRSLFSDSNPKSNGESEHSLNVAFEHSVRIDAVDVKHSNSASTTKPGSDDVVPVDSGARSLNVTLDHPGHIDGSGLMATGDDTISNSGNVGGVEGDSVTAADLPDVTTNSDDESNVNEEDDVDPDWSTYYSDEEDEENDDDDYEEDGMGSRMDFDDYPYTDYTDSEDDDDHLIDGFEINDSVRSCDTTFGLPAKREMSSLQIREAIENEMVERYTFKFKFQHRSSVSDDSVDVCAVCLVSFVDSEEVRRLPCFHLFHTGCVDPWLKKHKRVCPKCRLSINKASDYLNESAR